MAQAASRQRTLRLCSGDRARRACSTTSTSRIPTSPELRRTLLRRSRVKRCRGQSRYCCPSDISSKLPALPESLSSVFCTNSPQLESLIFKTFERHIKLDYQ